MVLQSIVDPPKNIRYDIGQCQISLGNISDGIKQLHELAEEGYQLAQVKLVPLLVHENESLVDWPKVEQWMKTASQSENVPIKGSAHYYLGHMYAYKLVQEPRDGESIAHLETAHAMGYEHSTYLLANLYEFGELTDKNIERAIELYKSLKGQDYSLSWGKLGVIYANRECESETEQSKNDQLALSHLTEALRLGKFPNPEEDKGMREEIEQLSYLVALNLAKMHVCESGGLDCDSSKIYTYLEHAAKAPEDDRGRSEILVALGAKCFKKRLECTENLDKARKAWEGAIELHNAQGWFNLGVLTLKKPEPTTLDVMDAIAYWRESLRMGFEEARVPFEKLVAGAMSLIENKPVAESSDLTQQESEDLGQKTRRLDAELKGLKGTKQVKWRKLRGLMGNCIEINGGSLKPGKGSGRVVTFGVNKFGYHHPHGRKENSFSGGRLRSLREAMEFQSD